DEIKILKNSGFKGGWYDIISLETTNLESMNAPYKLDEILTYVCKLDEDMNGKFLVEYDDILDRDTRILLNKPKSHTGSFFLGNPRSNIKTIRETLHNANKYKLSTIYDKTGINFGTRIFSYQKLSQNELRATYSVNFAGEIVKYDELFPSFSFPADLIDHFQDHEVIIEFFNYLQDTFLSSHYLFKIDWTEFLRKYINKENLIELWSSAKNTTNETVYSHIKEIQSYLELLSETNGLSQLYASKNDHKDYRLIQSIICTALIWVFKCKSDELKSILSFLRLPILVEQTFKLTSYDIMKNFYMNFSIDMIITYINDRNTSFEKLFLDFLFTYKNIHLEKKLIPFFN
ncbi:MAG: hypothetical protein ACW99Q_10530, partial [Candidatus Kariarchaeaceae archaeon]